MKPYQPAASLGLQQQATIVLLLGCSLNRLQGLYRPDYRAGSGPVEKDVFTGIVRGDQDRQHRFAAGGG